MAGGSPPNLGRIIRDHKPSDKRLVRKAMSKSLGGPEPHEGFEPYDYQDPMRRLLRNPNEPDVAYDLWAWHYLFKKLSGSANWWVRRNQFGIPKELWVIPTHWMRLVTGHHGLPSHYVVISPWGYQDDVPFDEVVTFYEHSPLNRWEGFAVNQAIGTWIDTYEASCVARLAQYKNGSIPNFHVQLGETYSDPDDQMLNRLYSKWFTRLRGEANTGVPIMTGPDVEIKSLGISPVDMGYIQNEDQLRDMTLAAYDVRKSIVGLVDGMTYGSNAADRSEFYTGAVNPDLHYNGQVISEKIIVPTGDETGLERYKDGCCFWDERRAYDPQLDMQEEESMMRDGTMTPNQRRAKHGMEPYEHGGDDPLINGTEMPWFTGGKSRLSQTLDQLPAGSDDAQQAQVDRAKQIMEMQQAVTEGKMTADMAIANVQVSFGVSGDQARQLFDAARIDDNANDAGINLAFRRSMNALSGVGGGYLNRPSYGLPREEETPDGLLRLRRKAMEKALTNGRHG